MAICSDATNAGELLRREVLTRLTLGPLFGVDLAGPRTFAAMTAALLRVTLLARYITAHRATKTDPMVARRYE